MGSLKVQAAAASLSAQCYRLTAKGRACVDVVAANGQTVGSLSRYMHDVLVLCGTGAWFDQLRQFMPPRSLEETLRALLALDLIEAVAAQEPSPIGRHGLQPIASAHRRLRIHTHPAAGLVTSGPVPFGNA
jgi:hypothetical protein